MTFLLRHDVPSVTLEALQTCLVFGDHYIRERTRAGLDAARGRGRVGGRPRRVSPEQIRMAQRLMANPDTTTTEVAEAVQVSRATLYRALKSGNGDMRDTGLI